MEKRQIIEILDTLHVTQVDIRFLYNLFNAWDIDKTIVTYNDMHGISRVCDTIDDNLIKVEVTLRKYLKEKEEARR